VRWGTCAGKGVQMGVARIATGRGTSVELVTALRERVDGEVRFDERTTPDRGGIA